MKSTDFDVSRRMGGNYPNHENMWHSPCFLKSLFFTQKGKLEPGYFTEAGCWTAFLNRKGETDFA